MRKKIPDLLYLAGDFLIFSPKEGAGSGIEGRSLRIG